MKDVIKAILVVLATSGLCYLFYLVTGLAEKFGDMNYLNWLGVNLIANLLNPYNKIIKDDAKGR